MTIRVCGQQPGKRLPDRNTENGALGVTTVGRREFTAKDPSPNVLTWGRRALTRELPC